MATKSRIVLGTVTEWSADNVNFETVPECTSLAIPTVQQEYVEVTNMDSPNGFREYIPGLKDAGEFGLPCNYTSDLFEQALAYQNAGQPIFFRITMPLEQGQASGDVLTYTALVTPSIDEGQSLGDAITLTLNCRTTGELGFAKGVAA